MQQKRCSNKKRCSKQNADILAQSGAESAQSGAESDVNLKVPVCVCVCVSVSVSVSAYVSVSVFVRLLVVSDADVK